MRDKWKFEEAVRKSGTIYERLEIPAELDQRIKKVLNEERGNTNMKKIHHYSKMTAAAVAALVCFTTALNCSQTFAAAAAKVPVIGAVSKVLTFRSYEKADEDKDIRVEIPQISNTALDGAPKQLAMDVNQQIQQIMGEYEAKAEQHIAEYKEAFLATGGTEAEFSEKNIRVEAGYEIKYESEDILSLVITANENWCGAYGIQYMYNLDLKKGVNLMLKDLLGDDYITIADESILQQMKERTAADSNLTYWDGSNGIPGFNGVDETTRFYIGKNGNPVIVFDKYEIAPGAFGRQEFEIQR